MGQSVRPRPDDPSRRSRFPRGQDVSPGHSPEASSSASISILDGWAMRETTAAAVPSNADRGRSSLSTCLTVADMQHTGSSANAPYVRGWPRDGRASDLRSIRHPACAGMGWPPRRTASFGCAPLPRMRGVLVHPDPCAPLGPGAVVAGGTPRRRPTSRVPGRCGRRSRCDRSAPYSHPRFVPKPPTVPAPRPRGPRSAPRPARAQ